MLLNGRREMNQNTKDYLFEELANFENYQSYLGRNSSIVQSSGDDNYDMWLLKCCAERTKRRGLEFTAVYDERPVFEPPYPMRPYYRGLVARSSIGYGTNTTIAKAA
jgi:hypothetical protein